MEQVGTKELVQSVIKSHELCIVYFTGSECGACEVIKRKVETILQRYPQVKSIEVNGAEHPEVAATYEVYTLPIMILFVEGKESVREGRNLDLLAFERKLQRYTEMMGSTTK